MDFLEILAGRAGLAGIQWALDARASRRRLRQEISSILSKAQLKSLQLRRAKFKPGKHLKAYFDARLKRDIDGHSELRPVMVIWRPAQEELDDELAEQRLALQAEAQRRGLVDPFRRLFGESPDWGMHLQISPLDIVFPQLVRLSDPVYVREMLAGIESGDPDGRQGGPGRQYSVTAVRYRPGERHVLRYDRAGPGRLAGRTSLFAKIYKDSQAGARAFKVANQVSDWLDSREDGVTGARPFAYLPQDGLILYPQVDGRQLSTDLKDMGKAAEAHLQLAGSILRSLHQAPGELADALKMRTFGDEIRLVKRASEHVQVLAPDTGEKVLEILERVQALHERLPQEPPTYTHSDYKADHLWVTPHGLTLIDFDTSSIFDPAIDIGKFLADLHWWYVLHERSGLEIAQDFFIQGYRSGSASGPRSAVPEDRLRRGRLYEAVVLTKITLRRVPIYDRSWAARTAGLISRAEGVVKKLEMSVGQPAPAGG